MKQLPRTSDFCVIAPTQYLDKIKLTSRHLCLAHIVKNDPSYADFYKQRSLAGDFIIMDNGAFELGQSYDPDQLVDLGKKCGADAVVLPDYPFQPSEKTIEACEKYAKIFKDNGFYTFFAVQGSNGSLEDWIKGYQYASSNDDVDMIGMSILGIPNALPNINPVYARVVMTAILQDRGIFNHMKYHHYLGLNSGPQLEIPSLIKMNALDSCDSSNPVWSAINKVQYRTDCDSYNPFIKQVLPPVDFDKCFNQSDVPLINANIELTLSLFKQ